jgi:hypothetical protein
MTQETQDRFTLAESKLGMNPHENKQLRYTKELVDLFETDLATKIRISKKIIEDKDVTLSRSVDLLLWGPELVEMLQKDNQTIALMGNWSSNPFEAHKHFCYLMTPEGEKDKILNLSTKEAQEKGYTIYYLHTYK